MSDKSKKQLVVIGAGPGGYAAAFHAADLGLKVTMIDPEVNPGGVCLYRGCIPSKALLHLSKIKQQAYEAKEWGIQFEEPKVDMKKIFNWKHKVVNELTQGLGELTKARKVEYIRGKARFKSDTELEVEDIEEDKDTTITFENVIIATGSSPAAIPNVEFDHEYIIDSTDALNLNKIPANMLVIGGGYIGLELGSAFAYFGCKVTVAEMTDGFLPGTDKDLIKVFEEDSEDVFEEVYFKTSVEKATVKGKKVKVSLKGEKSEEKEYDKVLVAVGRKPSTDTFNIENTGIETDDKGFIKVDEYRATTVKNIYAIGDVTGEPMLAHKASHEGRIAAEVIAGKKGAAFKPKVIPGAVFTNPEIAWCGLTDTTAAEKNVKVLKYPWVASGRAKAIGSSNGLTKLFVHPETGRILGGGVAGKGAASLIPEIALAVEMGATAEDLALTIHAHPTLSETIMESAESFLEGATHYLKK